MFPQAKDRVPIQSNPTVGLPVNISDEKARKTYESIIDPKKFCRVWLGVTPWEAQDRILDSVVANRKTAVKTVHSSSKTFTAAITTLWWLARWEKATVITTAPTKNQVEKLLWTEIHSIVNSPNCRYPFKDGSLSLTQLKMGPKRYALGFTTSVEKQDEGVKFQGFHNDHVLIILDEAPGVDPKIWKAIEGIMSSGDVRLLAIGNPTIVGGEFFNAFNSDRANWNCITISAFDTPNLKDIPGKNVKEKAKNLLSMTPDELATNIVPYLTSRYWVYEHIKTVGIENLDKNPFIQGRVLAEFPTQAEDSLFFLSWLDAAKLRPVDNTSFLMPNSLVRVTAGIDVAGPGEDETTLYIMAGSNILHSKFWTNRDPRGELLVELAPYQPYIDTVNVDSDGIGYYLARHIEDAKYPVSDVHVGAAPNDKEKFVNKKAELYWGLRMRAESGDLTGLVDDITIAQLTSIKWRTNARGQIEIESKEEARKRGIKSPDRAEGLMLANAPPSLHGLIDYWAQQADAMKTGIPVESSNVDKVYYDVSNQILGISFLGGNAVYHFLDVPQVVYQQMMQAESKGKYFINNIKGKYKCLESEAPPLPEGQIDLSGRGRIQDSTSLSEAQKHDAGWGDFFDKLKNKISLDTSNRNSYNPADPGKSSMSFSDSNNQNNDEIQAKSGIKTLGKVMVSPQCPSRCPNCKNAFVAEYAEGVWKCNHCGCHGVKDKMYVGGELVLL
jgi:phage terminase large subunit